MSQICGTSSSKFSESPVTGGESLVTSHASRTERILLNTITGSRPSSTRSLSSAYGESKIEE